MKFKIVLIVVAIFTLGASPLFADCWLACDDAYAEAERACSDAYSDPADYAECEGWAADDYTTCLDSCEIGDEYSPTPGPWWIGDVDGVRLVTPQKPSSLQTYADLSESRELSNRTKQPREMARILFAGVEPVLNRRTILREPLSCRQALTKTSSTM